MGARKLSYNTLYCIRSYKESSNNGNSYTTQFRQYDPRLGRWKSLDPLAGKFPSMSPFVAFNNNPIYFVDPLGLEGTNPQGGDDGNESPSSEEEKKNGKSKSEVDNKDGSTTTKNPDGSVTVVWDTGQYTDVSNPPDDKVKTKKKHFGVMARYQRVSDKSRGSGIKNPKRRARVSRRRTARAYRILHSPNYKRAKNKNRDSYYSSNNKDGEGVTPFSHFHKSIETPVWGPSASRLNSWSTNVVTVNPDGTLGVTTIGSFPSGVSGPSIWVIGNPYGQPAGTNIQTDVNNNILDNRTTVPTVLIAPPSNLNPSTDEIVVLGGNYVFYGANSVPVTMINTTGTVMVVRTIMHQVWDTPNSQPRTYYTSEIITNKIGK